MILSVDPQDDPAAYPPWNGNDISAADRVKLVDVRSDVHDGAGLRVAVIVRRRPQVLSRRRR